MDGLKFVNTLRDNNKYTQIPLIAFVFSDEESILNSYQAARINIVKQGPLFTEQLKEKIDSLLFN